MFTGILAQYACAIAATVLPPDMAQLRGLCSQEWGSLGSSEQKTQGYPAKSKKG